MDVRGRLAPQIVGIVLVRNEDVFVEQAIRNVAAFCDRIHALDHVSTDRTWDIAQRWVKVTLPLTASPGVLLFASKALMRFISATNWALLSFALADGQCFFTIPSISA